ncbi:MAG: hypothetical protein ACYTAF_02680 [Planctomycetota bacterium]|jgi:hypothetical protein
MGKAGEQDGDAQAWLTAAEKWQKEFEPFKINPFGVMTTYTLGHLGLLMIRNAIDLSRRMEALNRGAERVLSGKEIHAAAYAPRTRYLPWLIPLWISLATLGGLLLHVVGFVLLYARMHFSEYRLAAAAERLAGLARKRRVKVAAYDRSLTGPLRWVHRGFAIAALVFALITALFCFLTLPWTGHPIVYESDLSSVQTLVVISMIATFFLFIWPVTPGFSVNLHLEGGKEYLEELVKAVKKAGERPKACSNEKCGTWNVERARFCERCGKEL